MFLHQRFNYDAGVLVTDRQADAILQQFLHDSPNYTAFDTETTGLNVIKDEPFLISFGWKIGLYKRVYVFDPLLEPKMLETFLDILRHVRTFAHNVQYDHHMLENIGCDLSHIEFCDGMAVARLTQYADSLSRLSLESLGVQYVADDAKFGGHIISQRLAELRKVEKERIRTMFEKKFPDGHFQADFDMWKNRVQFVDYGCLNEEFAWFKMHYTEPNYWEIYRKYPDLMLNYAMDDVVILLEFLEKGMKTMGQTDPGWKTFRRESALVPHICAMERTGIKADVEYLLESRERVMDYQEELYAHLYEVTGQRFTVGQHKVISSILFKDFRIETDKCDEKALQAVIKQTDSGEVKDFVNTVLELRTIDKWLSTYIDGKLNAVVNGRLYSTINSQGTVSGRVSSNMQQQPKYALKTRDGVELFHPRKVFIPDEGCALVFFDFSQMELRLQAYYTMLVSGGDINLCRAYVPFECISDVTGERYDYKNPDHIERWDSGEWVRMEDHTVWEPTDLHNVTTFLAFPELGGDVNHPDFKEKRKLGKMCNFLKNYQGGVEAIKEQMGVDDATAQALDQAYYAAFPKVKDYQRWVTKELSLHGFIENLYGRRYYMQDSKWFYKAGNYVIQGGCADLVKQKELEVSEFLAKANVKAQFVLPVHDEMVFNVPLQELQTIITPIQNIIEDVQEKIPWIPMLTEIEFTTTNWAEKRKWEGE